MPEHDNERTVDRELKALFDAVEDPEEMNATRFAQGVMKRIRRRERMRSLALGAGIVVAAFLAMPALVEFSSAFTSMDFNVTETARGALNQFAASASAYARSNTGMVTLATTAVLAVFVVPLLRWLAD